MPISEAVLLFFLALLGVGGASYGVIRWDRRRIARIKGEENAQKLLKASCLTCLRCHAVIDPNHDVYYKGKTKQGNWWCKDCFKEIL